jgi:non-ribosomal peptide synthetase component E (peptide arylation enzyme)
MTNQTKKALWMPKHDADFILEPVAKALLTSGLPKNKALDALTEAAKRVLRLAVDDAGTKLTHTELDADARQVAEGLLKSVPNPRTKAA